MGKEVARAKLGLQDVQARFMDAIAPPAPPHMLDIAETGNKLKFKLTGLQKQAHLAGIKQ
jgi:hypothetical protein